MHCCKMLLIYLFLLNVQSGTCYFYNLIALNNNCILFSFVDKIIYFLTCQLKKSNFLTQQEMFLINYKYVIFKCRSLHLPRISHHFIRITFIMNNYTQIILPIAYRYLSLYSLPVFRRCAKSYVIFRKSSSAAVYIYTVKGVFYFQ